MIGGRASRDVNAGERTHSLSNNMPGRRFVSVVGIDRYRAWNRLYNAVSDAMGTLNLFLSLGFEVAGKPLLDGMATGDALRRLVIDDLAELGAQDSLVLFFAGHGHTVTRTYHDGASVKDGYLIPVDGEGADGRSGSWLRLESWLTDVTRIPAKHILVVLDACHSGLALGSIIRHRHRGLQTVRPEPFEQLHARRSRRVITSALDDQLAMDGGPVRGHSLFTGCLIEALTGGLVSSSGRRMSLVTGSEVGQYVQRRVSEYQGSTQTPDFGALELDDRGELIIHVASDPPPVSAEPTFVVNWHHLEAWEGAQGTRNNVDALAVSTTPRALPTSDIALDRAAADRLEVESPLSEVGQVSPDLATEPRDAGPDARAADAPPIRHVPTKLGGSRANPRQFRRILALFSTLGAVVACGLGLKLIVTNAGVPSPNANEGAQLDVARREESPSGRAETFSRNAEQPAEGAADAALANDAARAPITSELPAPKCSVDIGDVLSGGTVYINRYDSLGPVPEKLSLPCGNEVTLIIRTQKDRSSFELRRTIIPMAEKFRTATRHYRQSFALEVTSDPTHASITLNGKAVGVTPTTILVPGFDRMVLVISKGKDNTNSVLMIDDDGYTAHSDLGRLIDI